MSAFRINLQSIRQRVYGDYLMGSRLDYYEDILKAALNEGYLITSVIDYYEKICSGEADKIEKIIINRHDIDTDTATARRMFEIEKKLNVKSSSYFRLSTLDRKLMLDIEAYGSEASYHFEEIATFCKQHKIRSPDKLWPHMPEIQAEFKRNYDLLKKQLGLPMKTIASHGDFVNRTLGITNNKLLNPQLKAECQILVETYEPILRNNTVGVSDGVPEFLDAESEHSFDYALKHKMQRINLLTHPRHWKTAPWINTLDNTFRFWEGVRYYYL
jgi:hypothetical protein